MIWAFKEWAEKHPEAAGAYRLMGVIDALREAWPCK
jgi:hypothetical protein